MVQFGLPGIGECEGRDSLIERGAFAEVGGKNGRVAGAGVGPRQHLAAGGGVPPEAARRQSLHLRLDLGVTQLAHIYVPTGWSSGEARRL